MSVIVAGGGGRQESQAGDCSTQWDADKDIQ